MEEDELNVSGLAKKIGCRANQVSVEMRKIKDLDLVHYWHEGHKVFYSLEKPAVVQQIIGLARELSRSEDQS